MKKAFALAWVAIAAAAAAAQDAQKPFCGTLSNDEYNVYLTIDFHCDGITVPGHEILGNLPGYLAKRRNSFYWLITSARQSGKRNKGYAPAKPADNKKQHGEQCIRERQQSESRPRENHVLLFSLYLQNGRPHCTSSFPSQGWKMYIQVNYYASKEWLPVQSQEPRTPPT